MSKKFQNKYRVETTRLRSWNYGWNGAYFVTICTKNREFFFGEISNQQMNLSEIGEIADLCWKEIPNHFPFVELGEFVVMPNHLHGIIIIDKPHDGRNDSSKPPHVETQNFAAKNALDPENIPNPETQGIASLPGSKSKQKPQNQFGTQSKNLASIIRGFKIGVTKNAKKSVLIFNGNPDFMIILYEIKNLTIEFLITSEIIHPIGRKIHSIQSLELILPTPHPTHPSQSQLRRYQSKT